MRALLLEWGQIPQAEGNIRLKGDLVILCGGGQVAVIGFPLSSRWKQSSIFAFSHAQPSYLSVILCVFSTCYWRACCLFLRKRHWYNVSLSAFKLWFSQLPQLLTYLTVGSCMVEGNSQLLMCKQTLWSLALLLLHCCLVTKWFGRARGQSLSSLQVSLRAVPFGSLSATLPHAGIKGEGWVERITLYPQGSKGYVSDAFRASTCFLRNQI